MQKLDESYNNRDEGVSGEFVEVNRKLESLRGKINELVDWVFKYNNPPEWLHQELVEKVAKGLAELVERNEEKRKGEK